MSRSFDSEPDAMRAMHIDASDTNSSQNNLLKQLDTLITTRLSNFETRFSEQQREMSSVHLAKIEGLTAKSGYQFKRKGNEQQYYHCVDVYDKLQAAYTALSTQPVSSSSIDCARTKITEGMDLITHRQKLIKLADSSKHGWKIVEQYETHQLASDSDDEKRIHKAEARCEKIAKEERTLRNRKANRWAPYPPQQQSSAKQTSYKSSESPKPGVCFSCGVPGHWRKECQAAKNATSQKLSTHFLSNFDSERL